MADSKITDFAHRGYSRLLLVEGPDDIDFMYGLTGELNLRNDIWLHEVGGINNFQKALTALITSSEFQNLTHLGIVRDADYNTDALNSIQTQLQNANRHHQRHQFPIPQASKQIVGDDDLKVTIMVLPQAGVDGMLENLVLDALVDDSVMACVNEYFACLEADGIAVKQHVIAKAKVRTLLAGKAIDAAATYDESQVWEMRHMFKMSWWTWNHPTFDDVKASLRQLAQ